MKENKILVTSAEKDYELLDSGDGEKLERFGRLVLSRPDPQALWPKSLSQGEWEKADGVFVRSSLKGKWKLKNGAPEKWPIDFAGLKFWIEPTPFKHIGLFPEQKENWEWMKEKIKEVPETATFSSPAKLASRNLTTPEAGHSSRTPLSSEISARLPADRHGSNSPRAVESSVSAALQVHVLNLFGYTGGATLACAAAGASVVHVDGSKVSIKRAKENAELSGLADKPIRWILDDARDFVKRELRRGSKYDGIIMDPPSFGRGDKGQVWRIEEDFVPLFNDCFKLLSEKPILFLINGYAAGYSPIAYANNLKIPQKNFSGTIEAGELTIEGKGNLLPCGIFARWSR